MKSSHNYPLTATSDLFDVADNEAEAYVRWSAMAGVSIGQAAEVYTILEPGRRNGGPGPDFLRARIRFPDGATKTGDIEIHCRTAGWHQHGHRWDQRYSNVILHIVTGGSASPIKIGASQQAPTIYLPGHLPESKPCEINCAARPDQATIDQMITLLAAQRWYRRLARFTGIDPARQQMELALRLARGSAVEQLAQIWMQEFQKNMNMIGFIEGVLNRSQDLIGPGKKFAGRLAAGSALVWYHQHDPEKLWAMTFAEL
jgi:hypothetical protein